MTLIQQVLIDSLFFIVMYLLLYAFHLKKLHPRKAFYHSAFYYSIVIILMSTLSPILANLTSFFHLEAFEFNWIPFLDWKYQYGNYIEESIANIFLFIPFSLSYGICFRKRPYLAIPIGFFFSMFIEFTQALLLLNRVGDISDILTNTFGCILGVGLYYLIKERIYNINPNDKAKEKQLE